MGGPAQFLREVYVWATVCRRLFWLHPGYFESQIIKKTLPLVVLFFLVWGIAAKKFPWNCETFAKDQVGRAGIDIWFDCGANC